MRRIMVLALLVAALGLALRPQARGQDDYLVLALSWTPSWCEAEGTARGAARCAHGAGTGWLVHGLWPQHADGGWPEFCDSTHPAPDRALLADVSDVIGASGLAAHQWRKHGTCSGLSPTAYFDQTRTAFEALTFPDTIQTDAAGRRISPDQLLAEFRAANPGIGSEMVTLTCRAGRAQEIRLCLTSSLEPRRCDRQLLARGCQAREVRLPPRP